MVPDTHPESCPQLAEQEPQAAGRAELRGAHAGSQQEEGIRLGLVVDGHEAAQGEVAPGVAVADRDLKMVTRTVRDPSGNALKAREYCHGVPSVRRQVPEPLLLPGDL